MRFHQLPIGARFDYAGERYCKTGPLIAHSEATGRQRVLPRSATVSPQQEAALPAGTGDDETCYPLAAVSAALDAYHQACIEALACLPDPDLAGELRLELERARQAFTDTLTQASAVPPPQQGRT